MGKPAKNIWLILEKKINYKINRGLNLKIANAIILVLDFFLMTDQSMRHSSSKTAY